MQQGAELNQNAIRHRKSKITHPGRATKLRRKRCQQIREQRAMEENNHNHAHRDLDSLASSVSHIAAAAKQRAQAARRNRTCHF